MQHSHSFFEKRQKPLIIAACLYIIFLIASHSTLPPIHVWIIATIFSIIMNVVYIIEAYWQRRFIGLELLVAATLILGSVLGVLISPGFVIAAILGHGLWDLAKHFGAGIPFFSWYTLGCFSVDLVYGLLLLTYWFLN